MSWVRWLLHDDPEKRPDLRDRKAQIAQLEQRMRTARNRDTAIVDELRRLTVENNELKLYVAAIFRLLLDKRYIMPCELDEVIREIDLEDGVVDGQLTRPVLAD